MVNAPAKLENFNAKLIKNQNKYRHIQVIFFSTKKISNLKIFKKNKCRLKV